MPKHTKKSDNRFPEPANSDSKFAGLQPANTLDTLEPEGCNLEYLRSNRRECRKVSNVLIARSKEDGLEGDPLFKAGRNIKRCSLMGAFRSLSLTVNYKVGQALCKNRLCPNCQRVLATKRKYRFLQWFELNKEPLQKYYFYHMVLTVRHSTAENVRCGVYTRQLTTDFGKLRGGDGYRDNKEWWDKRVAGGTYSAEVKAGRDSSPHIHIHSLIIAKMPLWRKVRRVDAKKVKTVRNGQKRVYKVKKQKAASDMSEFEKEALARWHAITGDSSNGVFIEPVYTLDADKSKVYLTKGAENIESAVAECIKYTMKADSDSLAKYSNEFLRELLEGKNRYYARFGCLTKKNKLSAQFVSLHLLNTNPDKELESVTPDELRHLFNPETGELHKKEDTHIAVSWFANTTVQVSEVELRDRYSAAPQVTVPVEKSIVALDVPGLAPRYRDAYEGPSQIVNGMLTSALAPEPKKLLRSVRGKVLYEAPDRANDKEAAPLGGDTYYSFKQAEKVVYFKDNEKVMLARYLAGSMYTYYSPKNDLLFPDEL